MENQMSSKPNEPARAGYDAPRAQRLSDAARASGTQCTGNGSGAMRDCTNGDGAVACKDNGNYAQMGCSSGISAHECRVGNSAL
jgi:hypothetical protein